MNEPEKDAPPIRVTDRRRLDESGNLKAPLETEPVTQVAEPGPVESSAAEQPEAEATPPPREDPRLVALQRELDASRNRVDELARAYQAVTQDREEFKQRLTRERERLVDVEKGKVAVGLLEAIDELDLALQGAAQESSPLVTGVRLIRDKLLARAGAMGIERMSLLGQTFDPNVAEAGDMEVTGDPDKDQQVVAEMRAGYKLKDRIIRPARVKVAKYVQPAEA